jgi:hypothetical protein
MLSLPLCGFTPTTRFLYCRDLAFFLSDFYSGDRALIWVVSARRRSCLPFLRDSFLFRHMFGKSLREGNSRFLPLKHVRIEWFFLWLTFVCMSSWLIYAYIPLRDDFLFRTANSSGADTSRPFRGCAVASHLRLHLVTLGIDEGETMHCFRAVVRLLFPSSEHRWRMSLDALAGGVLIQQHITLWLKRSWTPSNLRECSVLVPDTC